MGCVGICGMCGHGELRDTGPQRSWVPDLCEESGSPWSAPPWLSPDQVWPVEGSGGRYAGECPGMKLRALLCGVKGGLVGNLTGCPWEGYVQHFGVERDHLTAGQKLGAGWGLSGGSCRSSYPGWTTTHPGPESASTIELQVPAWGSRDPPPCGSAGEPLISSSHE